MSALLDCLNREYAATGDFIELLELEAQAMTNANFRALPALAQRKSQLADQISALSGLRENAQLTMERIAGGIAPQRLGDSTGQEVEHAWSRLLERAALARERNHRNGVMIHTHLDFTRQSLSFLQSRGKPMYGPDGSHQAGAASSNRLAVG